MRASTLELIYTYGLAFLGFSFFFVRLNHVSEYVFIGLVVVWFLQKIKNRDFSLRATFLDVPILLFLGWALLVGFFAVDPQYSFAEWRKALPRFLIFWFVINVLNTERQVQSILFSSSIGLGVLCLLEVGHFIINGGDIFDFSMSASSRAGSLTGSSQWLSTYLVIGVPLIVLGAWSRPEIWVRCVYIVLCCTTALAVLVVHTRATWLAIVGEILIFSALTMKRHHQVIALIVVTCLGGIFLFIAPPNLSLMEDSQVTNPITLQLRFNTWEFAIGRIIENPLLAITGVGYGKHSFNRAYPDLESDMHSHIHNVFLSRLVQVGIPGIGFFLWIFGVILVQCAKGFHSFPNLYVGQLAMAILLSTAGLIVRSLLDDMFVGTVVYLFCLFIGLLFVVLGIHGVEKTTEQKRS